MEGNAHYESFTMLELGSSIISIRLSSNKIDNILNNCENKKLYINLWQREFDRNVCDWSTITVLYKGSNFLAFYLLIQIPCYSSIICGCSIDGNGAGFRNKQAIYFRK